MDARKKTPSTATDASALMDARKDPSTETSASAFMDERRASWTATSASAFLDASKDPSTVTDASALMDARKDPSTETSASAFMDERRDSWTATSASAFLDASKDPSTATSASALMDERKDPSMATSATAIMDARKAPSNPPPPPTSANDLNFEVLRLISATFDTTDLRAASAVCKSWREALHPLKMAVRFLRNGRWFENRPLPNNKLALQFYLRGAAQGYVPAMVEAGRLYWRMGQKEEGKTWFVRAAEFRHSGAYFYLGWCLSEEKPEEAVKWYFRASEMGNAYAQFNLAYCLHMGRGVMCNLPEAARWYLRAAEGGDVSGMYNTSLCYSSGEGFPVDLQCARIWMKRAADCGHRKAQYEHGLELFSSGDSLEALLYLELAIRAGETRALVVDTRNRIVLTLSARQRNHVMAYVDRWRPLPHLPDL